MTQIGTNWTTIGQSDNGRFHLKYQAYYSTQDVANNRTYVYRRLLLTVDTYGEISAVNYEFSGTNLNTASGGYIAYSAGDHVLTTGEGYVYHSSDGSWSQSVTGTANFGGAYVWTASGTATLPTIPRTSQPTLSTPSTNIGNSVTIYTNRASTSFTHDITATFGTSATVHSIATNVGDSAKFNSSSFVSALVNAKASSGNTYVYFTVTTKHGSTVIGTAQCNLLITINPSVPTLDKSSVTTGTNAVLSTNRTTTARIHTVVAKIGSTEILRQINVTTTFTFNTTTYRTEIMQAAGTTAKSVKVVFTVTTYLNSVSIGSKNVTLTVNVNTSTYKPTITFGTMTDRNTATSPYHTATQMINGLSKLRQVITFGVSESYELLDSATVTIGGRTFTPSVDGLSKLTYNLDVDNVSANKITVTVIDKRGTKVTASKTFTLLGYQVPNLTSTSVSRTSMTGEEAKFSIKGRGYAATYSGSSSVTNSITVKYRTRVVGGTYGSEKTAGTASLSGDGMTSWTVADTFPDAFDYSKQYEIRFTISDAFNTITQTLKLYNGVPPYGWGKTHFDVYGKFHIHDRTDASQKWVFPDALDAMMRTQGSKNLLQCRSSETTFRGVTFSYDSWNRVTAEGTATGGNAYINFGAFVCPRAGSYTFSGCPAGGSGTTYYLQVQSTTGASLGNDFGNGVTISCTYGTKYCVYLLIPDGQAVTGVTFTPMVRSAEIASPAFLPFAPPFSQMQNFALMPRGDVTNANSATDLGIYRVSDGTGTPSASGLLIVLNAFTWDASNLRWQVFLTSAPGIYVRYRNSSGTWTAWRQVTTTAV